MLEYQVGGLGIEADNRTGRVQSLEMGGYSNCDRDVFPVAIG